jgi:hypothetical protein
MARKVAKSLKTWPEFFEEVLAGRKNFELRVNDRDFQEGDKLTLREYDPVKKRYTGRRVKRIVTYVLYGPAFGLAEGSCIMSFKNPTFP